MVMPAKEKWFHDVIEHALLTELQLPVSPIKYRWFNKMNTESLTPPPFLAGNIREAMCYRVGNCTVMACIVGGMGTKTGFLLPARPNKWGASCWYLDLASGQGERPWLPRLWPIWKWWWEWMWTLWKPARTFWKMMKSVGFWVESSVAETVCWLGRWGCWVILGMFLISTTKYAG